MIKVGEKLITYQAGKEEAFTDAYTELLGYIYPRDFTLDSDSAHILEELECMVTEGEVWAAVMEIPPNRARGTDGFICAFYIKAWCLRIIHQSLVSSYVDGRRHAGGKTECAA
jgi:hypothetical protein